MKALGRPTRENVATSRDEQPTLLQSLELTNGTFFNNVLEEGANIWRENYEETEGLLEELYLRARGRLPNKKERSAVIKSFGDTLDEVNIQDLFWATLLLPEFQFIY